MTTNYARGSYQEIIDLHTEHDTVSVIGIHTPTGRAPRAMFGPFFDAFRQYHYDGCSISLVPAATLPADIAQVSYAAGDPAIDARDILNPIMFHGCHGEDMGMILDQFLNGPNPDSGSTATDSLNPITREVFQSGEISTMDANGKSTFMGDILQGIYYKALTDKSWAKAHPQRGFRKGGLHPLVYDVATNIAIPAGAPTATSGGQPGTNGANVVQNSYDDVSTGGGSLTVNGSGQVIKSSVLGDISIQGPTSSAQYGTVVRGLSRRSQQFFTPRMRGLGWLDTKVRHVETNLSFPISDNTTEAMQNSINAKLGADKVLHVDNTLPLLYMGLILLPPAYRAEQHFRLIINHRFSWRGYRSVSLSDFIEYANDESETSYGFAPYYDFQPHPDDSNKNVKDVATESFPVETEVIPDDL